MSEVEEVKSVGEQVEAQQPSLQDQVNFELAKQRILEDKLSNLKRLYELSDTRLKLSDASKEKLKSTIEVLITQL